MRLGLALQDETRASPEAHHVPQLVDVVRGHHQDLARRLQRQHALARHALVLRQWMHAELLAQPCHPFLQERWRYIGRAARKFRA